MYNPFACSRDVSCKGMVGSRRLLSRSVGKFMPLVQISRHGEVLDIAIQRDFGYFAMGRFGISCHGEILYVFALTRLPRFCYSEIFVILLFCGIAHRMCRLEIDGNSMGLFWINNWPNASSPFCWQDLLGDLP